MEAVQRIIAVPSWAYDFCYYYFAVAVIVAVYGIWALVKLFTLPGFVKKFIPSTTLAISIILSSGLAVVLTLMQFWVCRSALKPGSEKFANAAKMGMKTKEKFAVACANDGDCTAVMGTQPAGSLCTCGGRGFCGGCVMNNNMEPQASFGSDFAPIEGFSAMPMNTQMKHVGNPRPMRR